jgi:nitrite reductase (NADH) small subunit
MKGWIEIGTLDDIPRRGARCVVTPLGKIGVFRTQDDRVFAIEDRCPHKQGPLSQGIVHGMSVSCPLHNWAISLETGEAQGADKGAVRSFAVKRDGDRIFLEASMMLAVAKG